MKKMILSDMIYNFLETENKKGDSCGYIEKSNMIFIIVRLIITVNFKLV